MSNKPGIPAADNPGNGNGTIVLTRKRLDCSFLVAIAVASITGLAFSIVLGDLSPLLSPLGVMVLWLMSRFQIPVGGMPARRISATPGASALLAWVAFMSALLAGVLAFDRFVLGQGWDEPLQLYHLALYVPLLVVFFVGVWIIGQRVGW